MKRRTFFGVALAALFSGKLIEKLGAIKPQGSFTNNLVMDAGTWACLAQDYGVDPWIASLDPHGFPPCYVVGVDPCYVDPGDEVLNKRYKEWGEATRDMMADALFRETIR